MVLFNLQYLDEGNNCEFIVPNGELSSSGVYYKITVPTGEDVLGRIYSICRNGSGVRVLEADGDVSGVTLSPTRDASTTCTHKGLYSILGDCEWGKGLEGVLLPMEESGGEIISTGLRFNALPVVRSYPLVPSRRNWVPLSSMIEGVVSGTLIAHSQVKVTLGAYKLDFHKLKRSVDQHGKDAVLAQVPMARKTVTTRSPSGQLRRFRNKRRTPSSSSAPQERSVRSKMETLSLNDPPSSSSAPQEQERSVHWKMETLSLNDPRGSTPS